MDFRFANEKLRALYSEGKGSKDYPKAVFDSFLRRVRTILDAKDVRDLRAMRSLHFEKLKGSLKGKYSIRLSNGWRLIVTIAEGKSKGTIEIGEITNHYGD